MAEVSVLVVSHNRPADLARCVASVLAQDTHATLVVVDNASDAGAWPSLSLPTGATVVRSDTMLGPADAKNLGFAHIKTPIAVLLDDDSELKDPNILSRVLSVCHASPNAACLALNCQGSWLNSPPVEQMALLPHPWATRAPQQIAGERVWPVAEFIGAGCVFDMAAFRSVGGFPAGYGYGYEEPHLAYRLLDSGRTILYVQSIHVRHYHSTSWRLPDSNRIASLAANRCAMAGELFPGEWIPIAVASSAARMIRDSLRAKVHGVRLTVALNGLRRGLVRRRPLRRETVRMILGLRGRL